MAKGYKLPSSVDIQCEDRFSLLDSEEDVVSFWPLFTKIVEQPVNDAAALIDVLETIIVTRQSPKIDDYGFLRRFLEDYVPKTFFETTWPRLLEIALSMPELFPDHQLHILTEEEPDVLLSRRHVACLVIHQFLCTLEAPTWQDGFQSFHIWYPAEQPHHQAVQAYLTALFEYFTRLAGMQDGRSPLDDAVEEWPITFGLRTAQLPLSNKEHFSNTLDVVKVPEATTAPEVLGIHNGAAVISANKFVGFGRTGTQEETHVGASPECCPMVLITPPLKDHQVLIVKGVEAMITITGYGRVARCSETLHPLSDTNMQRSQWSQRTMLFMDALELDLHIDDHYYPDLASGKVKRELRKAYTAFQSTSLPHALRPVVFTGYWGCRTFGGNVEIKTLIQLAAASLAGCRLAFVCSGSEQEQFGSRLSRFLSDMRDKGCDHTHRLVEILLHLTPERLGRGSALDLVYEQLAN